MRTLTADQLAEHVASFVALLQDAVDSGASVGFVPPLADSVSRTYWDGVRSALLEGNRILLVAVEGGEVLGSVQLDLPTMPNAGHRAEVMKLMVHRTARRRGIGRALMVGLEDAARRAGRLLLVLDTRVGDSAERLYLGLGYARAGVIPRYALSAAGALDATVYMYKELD
ncbi:MAG TPA: GNAT family N-acetyltransferase [bacterium]|nr:GNAT family N-acetyltransferase [bacterium]